MEMEINVINKNNLETPLFLRESLLSTNPLFLSNFFMTALFAQILETRTPPNFRVGGL